MNTEMDKDKRDTPETPSPNKGKPTTRTPTSSPKKLVAMSKVKTETTSTPPSLSSGFTNSKAFDANSLKMTQAAFNISPDITATATSGSASASPSPSAQQAVSPSTTRVNSFPSLAELREHLDAMDYKSREIKKAKGGIGKVEETGEGEGEKEAGTKKENIKPNRRRASTLKYKPIVLSDLLSSEDSDGSSLDTRNDNAMPFPKDKIANDDGDDKRADTGPDTDTYGSRSLVPVTVTSPTVAQPDLHLDETPEGRAEAEATNRALERQMYKDKAEQLLPLFDADYEENMKKAMQAGAGKHATKGSELGDELEDLVVKGK